MGNCTNSFINIEEKTAIHPCYNHKAHDYARMHIPVAPKCNISCNYCSRKYDCVNESRPGVTSEVLTPEASLEKFKLVKSKLSNLSVVGIAGPGDALANFDEVKRTIQLIKEESPETVFCLSTNGLMLPFYANDIVELGISHVTITINTIDSKIGAKIYREVNYLGEKFTGQEGARIILQNQLSGLRYLSSKGIVCKVNIVMIKDINDKHIPEVVKKVKECGAFITNIMQMIPVEGSVFEDLPLVSNNELNAMRKSCEVDLKQMYHCKQCRADAIGTLSQDRSIDFRTNSCSKGCGSSLAFNKKDSIRYKFAISSKTGINIDEHFGHAEEFHIYDYIDGNIRFMEKRSVSKYCTGVQDCDYHENKIAVISEAVKDCNAVLVLRAGLEPRRVLGRQGIKVFQMYDKIDRGIEQAVELLHTP